MFGDVARNDGGTRVRGGRGSGEGGHGEGGTRVQGEEEDRRIWSRCCGRERGGSRWVVRGGRNKGSVAVARHVARGRQEEEEEVVVVVVVVVGHGRSDSGTWPQEEEEQVVVVTWP